MAMIVKIQMLY